MGLDGKCPRCNHRAPLVDYLAGAADGELVAAVLQLPPAVQGHYLRYFSLFRPASGRAIQTQKAIRLTQELADLVKLGYVSQQGKVDRPCHPIIWAQAMERMIEQIHSLTLPMKSHGYLKSIAWGLADKADAANEKQINVAEKHGGPRVSESRKQADLSPMDQWIQGLIDTKPTDKENARWHRQRRGME